MRVAHLAALALLAAAPLAAQQTAPKDDEAAPPAAAASDIPARFTAPVDAYDYVKREVMIPMRDGVKLYTVIVVPKGARTNTSSPSGRMPIMCGLSSRSARCLAS